MLQPAAVHRAIVIVDVESFGDPNRTNTHQLAVRDALYKALGQSFADAGIRWDDCATEDRGDGALILVPPIVPKSLLVTGLPACLAGNLARYNAACPAHEQIRLRMALHAGEVHQDAHGFTGASLNLAFRLVEAPESRAALRDSPGIMALVVSGWFYDDVVRHYPAAGPGCFREVNIEVKETRTLAWVRVLGAGKEPGQPAHAGAAVRHGRMEWTHIRTARTAGIASIVLLAVLALIGWAVLAHAGGNGRTDSTGTCPFTVDANGINIRFSPDGPATGNKLNKGDVFIANEIYSMTPGGQHWIGGWDSPDPEWIGWVGQKYLQESGPSSCFRGLPVKQ